MTTSVLTKTVLIASVRTTDDALVVDFDDGRSVSLPLAWYPRLLHGTARERSTYRLIGGGRGAHWPLLDEDLSAEGLLAGRSSGENEASLKRWLKARHTRIRELPPKK